MMQISALRLLSLGVRQQNVGAIASKLLHTSTSLQFASKTSTPAEPLKASALRSKTLGKLVAQPSVGKSIAVKASKKVQPKKIVKAAKKVQAKKIVKAAKKAVPKKVAKPVKAEKPSRLLSPYIFFIKSSIPTMKRENPAFKASDIVKKAASEWKSLSDVKKQPFVEQAEKYNNTILAQRQKVEDLKKLNPRPLSPYTTFFTKHYAKFKAENPDLKVVDIAKKVATLWKGVPEAEKKAKSDTFKTDFLQWKKKAQLAA